MKSLRPEAMCENHKSEVLRSSGNLVNFKVIVLTEKLMDEMCGKKQQATRIEGIRFVFLFH